MLHLDKVHARPAWIDEFLPKKKEKKKNEEWDVDQDDDEELQFRNEVWIDQHDHHAVDDRDRLIGTSDPSIRSRLHSESAEDISRVLSQRQKSKPTLFTKVRNLLDFDQQFVKDGKPIMSTFLLLPPSMTCSGRGLTNLVVNSSNEDWAQDLFR